MKKLFLLILCFFVIAMDCCVAQVYKYTTADLNLRQAPSTNSRIITIIPKGTCFVFSSYTNQEWQHVSYNSYYEGYVSSRYLSSSKPYSSYSNYNRGSKTTTTYYYYDDDDDNDDDYGSYRSRSSAYSAGESKGEDDGYYDGSNGYSYEYSYDDSDCSGYYCDEYEDGYREGYDDGYESGKRNRRYEEDEDDDD